MNKMVGGYSMLQSSRGQPLQAVWRTQGDREIANAGAGDEHAWKRLP